MSKRKALSVDEKKVRMIQLFHEKKEFFQLKDLEKIAPKEKGVTANSVKDIIQSLVDDGSVDTDKIGTSIYFWAFPSKAENSKKRKLKELNEKYESTRKKLKTTLEVLEKSKEGKENNEERNNLLDEIRELQIERDELTDKWQKYKDNDPEVLDKIRKEIQNMKDAANRWTDNIFLIKTWCKNKFSYEDSMLNKQFGIPSDFDYIG